jgi:ATP-dependent RNA helicase DHX8/PRP22
MEGEQLFEPVVFRELHTRAGRRVQDVWKQLLGIMDRYEHNIISAGRDYNRVRRAICSGFFRHAAKDPQG